MTDFARCRYCNARIAPGRHIRFAHIERPDHFVSPHYAAPTARAVAKPPVIATAPAAGRMGSQGRRP